ncbi:MAG: PAS domain S-box protein [Alphaproteobacteria bacterium]|nr:PAS domain S-box protein [Alphaproteobacteria bacterium]
MTRDGGDKSERRKNRMPRAGRTVWRAKEGDPSSLADQLVEANRRLGDITRLVSDWVWETDCNYNIAYVSDRVFQVLGLLPVHFHGKNLKDIGTFLSREDDKPLVLDERPFRDLPFEMKGVDGQRRQFLLSGLPVFDSRTGRFVAVRGTARDITEQREAENTSLRLSMAVEALDDHIVLHDSQDRLIYCSPAYRRINEPVLETTVPGTPF